MKTIKELRIALGLSQRDMSQFLGLGRSTLTAAEQGHRDLTLTALHKLAQIEIALQSIDADPLSAKQRIPPESEIPGHAEKQAARLHNCRYSVAALQLTLTEMEREYQQNAKLYHVLSALSEQEEPEKRLWLEFNISKLKIKLQSCGTTAQQQLHEKIFLLTAEAGYISQYLEKHPSNEEPIL